MEYKISDTVKWGALFGFPASIVENFIKISSGSAIKVLLLIFKEGAYDISPNRLSEQLALPLDDIYDCLSFWSQEGVLSCVTPEVEKQDLEIPIEQKQSEETETKSETVVKFIGEKRPKYARNDVVEAINSDKRLKDLLEESQNILGKTLSAVDMESLMAMYLYYGMSAHFIIMVLQYCSTINKNSMPYAEKTAISWLALGVDDSTINNHMDQIAVYNSTESRIRRLLGIENRVIKPFEIEKIHKWCLDYDVSDELILYSFEITRENTNKISFSYQDTILTRWYEDGIKTVEEAKIDTKYFKNQIKSIRKAPKPVIPSTTFADIPNINELLEKQFETSSFDNMFLVRNKI